MSMALSRFLLIAILLWVEHSPPCSLFFLNWQFLRYLQLQTVGLISREDLNEMVRTQPSLFEPKHPIHYVLPSTVNPSKRTESKFRKQVGKSLTLLFWCMVAPAVVSGAPKDGVLNIGPAPS